MLLKYLGRLEAEEALLNEKPAEVKEEKIF